MVSTVFLYRAHAPPESVVCVHRTGARRRQVLHFSVTEHPTAAWTALQMVEAFEDRDAARYLLRDCFFVIEHGRRKILHYNVTRRPTAYVESVLIP
jgi:hypothetical protein